MNKIVDFKFEVLARTDEYQHPKTSNLNILKRILKFMDIDVIMTKQTIKYISFLK